MGSMTVDVLIQLKLGLANCDANEPERDCAVRS